MAKHEICLLTSAFNHIGLYRSCTVHNTGGEDRSIDPRSESRLDHARAFPIHSAFVLGYSVSANIAINYIGLYTMFQKKTGPFAYPCRRLQPALDEHHLRAHGSHAVSTPANPRR